MGGPPSGIERMNELESLSAEELLAAFAQMVSTNQLLAYEPYPWQKRFHEAGAWAPERMSMCANGVGKTHAISAELAMHCTGQYPPWWTGLRFPRGGWEAWCGSIDNDMQKIGLQRALLGRDLGEHLGTGWVPRSAILNINIRQAGVKEVVDTATIQHASGDQVVIKFKTYEQGWRKWQSGEPKVILMDEEPDENAVDQRDVFTEIQTRLVRNAGVLLVGYTPLLGETLLTRHFMYPKSDGIWWVGATWDDAPHLREEDKERLRASYPSHQLEARTMGVPMMGEGRIFETPESRFVIDPMEIPAHWARIAGIDFGISHPAAVAWLAIDRDTDTVYVTDVWREANAKTQVHAAAINSRGTWIPVAWPHDGEKRDPHSGERFAETYRNVYQVRMLGHSARYKNDVGGGQAQWPIIEDVRQRLDEGRFKVFRTCREWLEEYRSYHTKNGKIVSVRDDALKASFYALMMRRYAVSSAQGTRHALQTANMPAAFTTAVH